MIRYGLAKYVDGVWWKERIFGILYEICNKSSVKYNGVDQNSANEAD